MNMKSFLDHKNTYDKTSAQAKAAKHEFKRNAGTDAMRIIAVRCAMVFVAAIMFELCIGTMMWSTNNDKKPKSERVPFDDAVKNAYNVTNLVQIKKWKRGPHDNISDAMETIIALLGIGGAAVVARTKLRHDNQIAQDTIEIIQDEINPESEVGHLTIGRLKDLTNQSLLRHKRPDTWLLHPVSRPIVEHMATKNPALFNNLVNGTTQDVNIDYAIAVLDGHLQSHPDDLQRALDALRAHILPQSLKEEHIR